MSSELVELQNYDETFAHETFNLVLYMETER